MFDGSAVLAAVLLTAPAESFPRQAEGEPPDPNAPRVAALLEVLQAPLTAMAINDETMDAREAGYPIGDPIQWTQALAARGNELKSAPRLGDAALFGLERPTLDAWCAVNRATRCRLVKQLEISAFFEETIRAAIIDVDRQYAALEALREAMSGVYFTYVRRQSLATLRGLLGPQAFYSGDAGALVPR